jgi:hypothetical protein
VSARDLDSAWKTDGTAMQSHDVMTQSTAAQAAKPGRPTLSPGQGKDARLGFRVNPGHRDAWQEKDGEAGKSLA